MFDNIATAAATQTQNTGRPDLPPLTPYNAVSLWVAVNTETGEVNPADMKTFSHPIGKTGAGLNAAFDRILKSIHDKGDKGFGMLEGYHFEALAVVPAPTT
jgi:hypothetical protein